MEEIKRMTRILEYTGDEKWIMSTLNVSEIPAIGTKAFGHNTISSGIIGLVPTDIIDKDVSSVKRAVALVKRLIDKTDNSNHKKDLYDILDVFQL